MHKLIKCIVCVLLCFPLQKGLAEGTCCVRTVAVLPISGAETSDSAAIDGAWASIFMDAGEADCPIVVDFIYMQGAQNLNDLIDLMIEKSTGQKPDPDRRKTGVHSDLDYQFRGSLSHNESARTYTLDMQLFDPDHNEVVKEGSVSWTVAANDESPLGPKGLAAVKELSQSFSPLDEIIYDYERIPERCDIEPEEDPIEPKKTMNINIGNIVDQQSRTSAEWQWILVKVDKGKITNGCARDDFRAFQVKGGSVAVQYEAPDTCEPDEEKVYVYNTCNKESECTPVPMNEIGRETFKIEPKKIDGELEYAYEGIQKGLPTSWGVPMSGGVDLQFSLTVSGKIPFTIDLSQDPPTIKGKGSVTVKESNIQRTETNIKIDYKYEGIGSEDWELSGTLEGKEKDQRLLIIKAKKTHKPLTTSTHFIAESIVLFSETGKKGTNHCSYAEFRMKFKDGDILTWVPSDEMTSCKHTLILHIPCMKK
ncbi:MAG: hypothetical protein JXB26_05240 [Candidatus Aminicenantes bacterium]|nr:hypothetical protein [Candidatus Aminicenantes bacterium]